MQAWPCLFVFSAVCGCDLAAMGFFALRFLFTCSGFSGVDFLLQVAALLCFWCCLRGNGIHSMLRVVLPLSTSILYLALFDLDDCRVCHSAILDWLIGVRGIVFLQASYKALLGGSFFGSATLQSASFLITISETLVGMCYALDNSLCSDNPSSWNTRVTPIQVFGNHGSNVGSSSLSTSLGQQILIDKVNHIHMSDPLSSNTSTSLETNCLASSNQANVLRATLPVQNASIGQASFQKKRKRAV
ncbi:hypothetical protein D5086_031819 [Populus alba]|uniref:Uncharacterized protein n=1 Tax=Populus alba TaxID=43335 RepID=A0ACC4AKA5_POPAL